MEADLPLVRRHGLERIGGRRAGLGIIAEELDVAAERNGGHLPAGAVAVVETEQFRAEAKRKRQDLHPGPAGDEEMAKLMEENNDGQDKQERDDVADQAMTQRIETIQEKIHNPIPHSGPSGPVPNALRCL